MKRILAVLSLLVFSSAAFAEEVMVSNKEAKIRNGPGKNYTILWKPHVYTPLEVLAKYSDWYAVRDIDKDVGWIHESSVSKDKGGIVTEKVVDVHESADGQSRILYKAPKTYTFKVVEEKEGWANVVDPDNEKGWVEKKGIWTGSEEVKKAKKASKKEGKKEGTKKSAKEHKEHKKKAE